MTEQADYDAWARETPDTAAARGRNALTMALNDLAANAVEGCILEQVILYGTYTDHRSGYAGNLRRTVKPDELRAVIAENASLRAQRDAMESALNKANAELHVITRCGDVFDPIASGPPVHPCARERGHAGAHGNTDGAQWWPHPTGVYAPDAAERIAALPDMTITLNGPATWHFSPGYDGEKPDHPGSFDTCPMPACVKSRGQNAAADAIQDLTLQHLANQDPE